MRRMLVRGPLQPLATPTSILCSITQGGPAFVQFQLDLKLKLLQKILM
jgi:hypothetical protein